MSSYLMLFLLLLDIYSKCVIAYLSSPHVGQEPVYTAQQSPVMSSSVALTASSTAPVVTDSYLSRCPSGALCSRLPADCIICAFHHNCSYGRPANFTCSAKAGVHCVSEQSRPQQNFTLTLDCRFCWQLDPSQYRCSNSTGCMTVSCPRRLYNATCEALEHVHCLGTHSHTHSLGTHTHSLLHTHTHTLTRYTHTLAHTHSYTHTSHTLTLTHSLGTRTHSHTHTLAHTHSYTLTHSLGTHTHSHLHTHSVH
uniref:TM2 domain-containing protein 3-like n=1 Tax=Sinocyclocheilus grahami TaxID=75366 RepID=A0A672S8R6_SINGR